MTERAEFATCCKVGKHKGFYNDTDPEHELSQIWFSDWEKYDNDDEFVYTTADILLAGSCQLFALALQNKLGYTPYVIEGLNDKGFHAFCQVYKNYEWYFVDARGVTTSFDEFMKIASRFVSDEFIIRPITDTDREEWKKDLNYEDIGFQFAEEVIEANRECYTL